MLDMHRVEIAEDRIRRWLFFFKQKTAYEMRISDWSSDVCSSDLPTLWSLLARTLAVTAGVLALALGIGLPMAVLVARTDVIRRGPALILHAIPALLPPLLPALGWFHLLGRDRKSTRLNSSH